MASIGSCVYHFPWPHVSTWPSGQSVENLETCHTALVEESRASAVLGWKLCRHEEEVTGDPDGRENILRFRLSSQYVPHIAALDTAIVITAAFPFLPERDIARFQVQGLILDIPLSKVWASWGVGKAFPSLEGMF